MKAGADMDLKAVMMDSRKVACCSSFFFLRGTDDRHSNPGIEFSSAA